MVRFIFEKVLRQKKVADDGAESEGRNKTEIERSGLSHVDVKLISQVFDEKYYLSKNPDLLGWSDPIINHYVQHGWTEGRSPNPFFDIHWYKEMNRDVDFTSQEVVTHYLKTGETEGRWPHPLFNPRWYLERYSILAAEGQSPFVHFLKIGLADGREVSPFFETWWYRRVYKDQIPAGMHPIVHFLEFGASGAFDPNPSFSSEFYLAFNDDIREGGLHPYLHFLKHGRQEGRRPTPVQVGREQTQSVARLNLAGFSAHRDDEPKAEVTALDLSDISDAKLVSFDVWNTLLHRDCHPDEIKLQSARYLFLIAFEQLRPAYRSARSLYSARVHAENNSCPHGDFEYRFDDVVRLWLSNVLYDDVSDARRSEITNLLAEHEFQSEFRATRPDSTTAPAIASLQQPYIFASDFYHNARFIRRLLKKHGIGRAWAGGYSSCDSYENKRSGRQFNRILRDYSLSSSDLLHVGDNIHADQQVPASLGIRTRAFNPSSEVERTRWYGAAFRSYLDDGSNEAHDNRILTLLDDLATSGKEKSLFRRIRDQDLFRLGIRLAPIAFSFCLSILQQLVRDCEERVFFFTREGVILKRLFDAICDENPFNLTRHPSSSLLSVSRRATFAASLRDVTPQELMRLWNLYSSQSVKSLAKSLNLDEAVVRRICRRHKLSYNQDIQYPWKDSRVLKLLTDDKFQAHVRESISRQATALRSYLGQQGFPIDGGQRATIVDIGWRGTIQDNLAWLTGSETLGHYFGLFPYLNLQPPHSAKVGWFADANLPGSGSMPNEVAPLEMIFNGLGGTVIGYRTSGEAVVPVTEIVEQEEAVARKLAPLQQGMLEAIPLLCRYVRLHGLVAEDVRGLGANLIRSLVEEPPVSIANLFAELGHNETFGRGEIDTVGGKSFANISVQMEPAEVHAAISEWLAAVRWKESALRRTSVSDWWRRAPARQRAAAPLSLSILYSPSINRIRGEKLSVYTPPVLRASGGHRTIFNMVRRLAAAGMEPHIFLEDEGAGFSVVEEYLSGCKARLYNGWRDHIRPTAAFATIAHSAKFVRKNVSAVERFYFVQDAEALFNPVGDAYVTGENSYAQGLHHITIGNWLSHLINAQYGAISLPSGLGVDTDVYRNKGEERSQAICMLYQPEKPRRGSDLAIEALRQLKARQPGVEIYLYGSDVHANLDFTTHQLGIIHDVNELNSLYNRCRVGLCISLTNPSRIPYEMMAAGCLPVDLYRYNNLMDHDDDMIILTYQSAESVSLGLEMALERNTKETSSNISKRASIRTLEWENDNIVGHVLNVFEQRKVHRDLPAVRYTQPPILAPCDMNSSVKAFCAWQMHLTDGPLSAGAWRGPGSD